MDNEVTPPGPRHGAPTVPHDYAGLDHEDPEVIIRRCEDVFQRHEVENDQFVCVAEKGIKEEAQKWWFVYKNLCIEWDKFKELHRG